MESGVPMVKQDGRTAPWQRGKLAEALAKAQGMFPSITKTRTAKVESQRGRYTYNYADLADVLDVVRPVLSSCGLAVMQLPRVEDATVVVTTVLMHTSGEEVSGELAMPCGDATPQRIGSAISYARRYALCAILGISPEQEDDDGASAEDGARSAPRRDPARVPATPANNATRAAQEVVAEGAVTASLDLVIDSGSLKGMKVRDLTPEQVTGCRGVIDGMLADAHPARKPYLTALLASLLLAQGHGERGAAA